MLMELLMQFMERTLSDMNEKLARALLWVIYEQCVYGDKAYARLLIHGEEAFDALGLPYECDVQMIEDYLFGEKNKK